MHIIQPDPAEKSDTVMCTFVCWKTCFIILATSSHFIRSSPQPIRGMDILVTPCRVQVGPHVLQAQPEALGGRPVTGLLLCDQVIHEPVVSRERSALLGGVSVGLAMRTFMLSMSVCRRVCFIILQ